MTLDRLKDIKLLRKLIYAIIGPITYPGLAIVNKLKISGTEHLKGLPKTNVLFVSNHQTYFADVMAFLHIFCAVKWGKKNKLGMPLYFLNPFVDVNFVAAEETMKDNLLTRVFTLAGAITIKRTWRAAGKDVKREDGCKGLQQDTGCPRQKMGDHFSARYTQSPSLRVAREPLISSRKCSRS